MASLVGFDRTEKNLSQVSVKLGFNSIHLKISSYEEDFMQHISFPLEGTAFLLNIYTKMFIRFPSLYIH